MYFTHAVLLVLRFQYLTSWSAKRDRYLPIYKMFYNELAFKNVDFYVLGGFRKYNLLFDIDVLTFCWCLVIYYSLQRSKYLVIILTDLLRNIWIKVPDLLHTKQ